MMGAFDGGWAIGIGAWGETIVRRGKDEDER